MPLGEAPALPVVDHQGLRARRRLPEGHRSAGVDAAAQQLLRQRAEALGSVVRPAIPDRGQQSFQHFPQLRPRLPAHGDQLRAAYGQLARVQGKPGGLFQQGGKPVPPRQGSQQRSILPAQETDRGKQLPPVPGQGHFQSFRKTKKPLFRLVVEAKRLRQGFRLRPFQTSAEQGHAQAEIRRSAVQRPRVFPDRRLAQARQHHRQHRRKRLRRRSRLRRSEKTPQLGKDPLRADGPQQLPAGQHGLSRLGLNGKAQPGGKAQSPQDSQGVLPEALLRRSHAADALSFQVLLPAEQVHHLPRSVQGHGVHGEVPPPQVLRQGGDEAHAVGPPVVGIGPFRAVGGDLRDPAAAADGDGAVLHARGDGVLLSEAGHDLLRQGGGADVPVPGLKPQQTVPHAAPHALGLIAFGAQPRQNGGDLLRYGDHFPSFRAAMAATSLNRSVMTP